MTEGRREGREERREERGEEAGLLLEELGPEAIAEDEIGGATERFGKNVRLITLMLEDWKDDLHLMSK